MLALMGGDEWSITQGYRYTQWMLGGNERSRPAFLSTLTIINRGQMNLWN
jgi:hypothetical protein